VLEFDAKDGREYEKKEFSGRGSLGPWRPMLERIRRAEGERTVERLHLDESS